jgi:predicted ATPase
MVQGAQAVVAALGGAFHLDPVPHLMRDYANKRDTDLRRTGENISAAIAHIQEADADTFQRLTRLIQEVADERISGIEIMPSTLGDVMLALREGTENHQLTPAREMSDGLLRFMAIATALLTADRGLDVDGIASAEALSGAVLLVVEEIENGLHPSQAARILSLIRETSQREGVQVALTTHSPALLNALPGELNHNVLVCYRDAETGFSKLTRLTELPGYAEAMSSGRLGDVVAADRLVRPEETSGDFSEFNRLLGIE